MIDTRRKSDNARTDKADAKTAILAAARRLILEKGVSALTLEAVAEAAGLSKGGLLYHFRSKEALLSAMVERLIAVTEDRVGGYQQQDGEPGSWARGYLAACLADVDPDPEETGRMAVAVLAAAASNRDLLQPLRARQEHWRQQLRLDGIDPATAQLVRLAADGLWMNEIFGTSALTREERTAVVNRLEALTR